MTAKKFCGFKTSVARLCKNTVSCTNWVEKLDNLSIYINICSTLQFILDIDYPMDVVFYCCCHLTLTFVTDCNIFLSIELYLFCVVCVLVFHIRTDLLTLCFRNDKNKDIVRFVLSSR